MLVNDIKVKLYWYFWCHGLNITFLKEKIFFLDKKVAGKSKDEQMAEKKQELEKRLLDVNDKIGNSKKAPKKG